MANRIDDEEVEQSPNLDHKLIADPECDLTYGVSARSPFTRIILLLTKPILHPLHECLHKSGRLILSPDHMVIIGS